MYNAGFGMTATTTAAGGTLAFTGVQNITFMIVLGVLLLLIGAALVVNSVHRDRKEALTAGV